MFVIATFLVGMVALLAYWLAYMYYPRFALPPLDVGLVFPLAVLAGLASLFSPCSFLTGDFWYRRDCVKAPAPKWVILACPRSCYWSKHLLCRPWDTGGTWRGKEPGGSDISQPSWPSLTDTCRPGSACIGSRANRCLGIPAWLPESMGTSDCPENGGSFVRASSIGWYRL